MTLKSIWVDYCENGSIHGLRHIIQKDEKPWMRFIWVLLLIVASIAIVVLVSASWEKYSYSSMEITVDDPRYPITKIDFPAVTICPISKIMYSKALDLVLNKYSNDSDLRIKWANSLQALSRMQFPHNTNLYFILQNKSTVNIPLNDISDLMLKLAPSIEDIFQKCIWRGAMYKCKDILRFQRTEEGFCYSFNSQTAERNVNDQSQINPPLIGSDGVLIPLRNNAAGKGTGLSLIMSNMSDNFFPNDNRRRGFNVMVHTSDSFPDVATAYKVHAVRHRITRISVSVAQVEADDSLDRLDNTNSHCYLYKAKTKYLSSLLHKSSSEDTCFIKCRMRAIYNACNCTQYFFKLYKGLGSHCGIEHIPCLIANDILQRNPKVPEDVPGFPKWSIPFSMNCSCRPPCSFMAYTTELRYEVRQFVNNEPPSSRYDVYLEVNYRELYATSYRRSMRYTTQDLLVSFGGLASLFLGCSLVSIVEILYVIYKSFLVLALHLYNNNLAQRDKTDVMVHTSDSFPDVATAYKVHAVRHRITRISVSVAQVEADDSLDRLDNTNSHCYLYKAKTKYLSSLLHKSSSEDTCFIKCRMRAIYNACNCTQYFFKLYKGLGSHCGIEHIPCLIANDILQRNPKVPEDVPGFPKWSIPFSMNCSCRPPCSFMAYTTELRYEVRQFVNNEPPSSRYDVYLEVNYRELYATSYRRSMRYTTQDLLVSFGGLASLFLGCSLVSIVEILYVIYKSFLVLALHLYNNNLAQRDKTDVKRSH